MIIYGTRASELTTQRLNNEVCTNCNNQGSIVLALFSRYAHIFWIPLFPFAKTGVSQCEHCKQTLEPKQMTGSLRQEYDNLKASYKTPAWQFVGLALIAVLAVVIYTGGQKDKEREQGYILSPQAGDVYEFKTETKNYSTMKVIEVVGDSVFLKQNQYETTKMSGINGIDKEENYDDTEYVITKSNLKDLYEEGTIYDVNR